MRNIALRPITSGLASRSKTVRPSISAVAMAIAVFASAATGAAHAQSFDANLYRWPDGVNAIFNSNRSFFREGSVETRTTRVAYGTSVMSILGLQCNLFTDAERERHYGMAGMMLGIFKGGVFNPGAAGENDGFRFIKTYDCKSKKTRDTFAFLKAATYLGPENPDAPF